MNKITEEQIKNSPRLLNQYYLRQFNAKMVRLDKFASGNIVIQQQGDEVIDEKDEIQLEHREQQQIRYLATNHTTNPSHNKNNIQTQKQSLEILESKKKGYSKKSPQKPIRQEKKQKVSDTKQTSSPSKYETFCEQIGSRKQLFDFNKPLNSIRQVSQTSQLFGPTKTIFSSKSKQISTIPKNPTDFLESRSIGEQSYYSAAVQSKLSSKGSPLKKCKRQKKNFKKMLLQRKYQTANLNQTTYKSEHESQLYIRQDLQPELVNFSVMSHQKKQVQEDKKQQILLIKDFKKVSESLQRELNQQGNWQNSPDIPQGKSTLLVMKPIKEQLVDRISIFQNVDVKQYQDDDVAYSDDQVPEQSQFHQAIGQVFQQRLQRSKTTSPLKINKINQEEQSQQPSIPPQKFSEKYSEKHSQKDDNSSVFSSQYNYNPSYKKAKVNNSCGQILLPNQSISQKSRIEQQFIKKQKQQYQTLKVQEQQRQKRARVEYQKEEILYKIQSREWGVLRSSIQRIAQILTNSSIQLSVQQILVTTAKKLVSDSEQLEYKIKIKEEEMQEKRLGVCHLLDQKGKRKKSEYYQQMQSIMRNPGGMQAENQEQQGNLIVVNKVIIKKLIQKYCILIEQKASHENHF